MSTPARYLVWWMETDAQGRGVWVKEGRETWEQAVAFWQELRAHLTPEAEVLITEHCPVVVRYEDGRTTLPPLELTTPREELAQGEERQGILKRLREEQERSNKFERRTSPPPPWPGAIPVDRGHLCEEDLR